MNIASTRKVVALAIGTVLLTLSPPGANAGPGNGPGSDIPSPKPPLLHASENPVVFGPFETTRYIDLTAKAYTATVRVICKENGVQKGPGATIIAGTPTDVVSEITYGKTKTCRLETFPEDGQPKEVGPLLTITTVRPEVATTAPQTPPITVNPTVIPRRGRPPTPGDAAEQAPDSDRRHPSVDSPDGRTTP
jgi:hypothetical protein